MDEADLKFIFSKLICYCDVINLSENWFNANSG